MKSIPASLPNIIFITKDIATSIRAALRKTLTIFPTESKRAIRSRTPIKMIILISIMKKPPLASTYIGTLQSV